MNSLKSLRKKKSSMKKLKLNESLKNGETRLISWPRSGMCLLMKSRSDLLKNKRKKNVKKLRRNESKLKRRRLLLKLN